MSKVQGPTQGLALIVYRSAMRMAHNMQAARAALRMGPSQRVADFGPCRSIRRDGNTVFARSAVCHDPLENHPPQAGKNSGKDHGQNPRLSVLGHAAILVTQTTPRPVPPSFSARRSRRALKTPTSTGRSRELARTTGPLHRSPANRVCSDLAGRMGMQARGAPPLFRKTLPLNTVAEHCLEAVPA